MIDRHVSTVAFAVALAVTAIPAYAHDDQTLSFARPESWAMKYYASLTLFTGVGAPETSRAGELELQLEGGDVPQLSARQRRVGFDGTKVEDVNKTRVFGRVRAGVGLGRGFVVEAGYTPPIRTGGAKPNILALAVGRSFDVSWLRLGARALGQIGSIEGDITCSTSEVAAGDDPQANPFGCVAPSTDRNRQRIAGLELSVGPNGPRFKPYVGVGVDVMALEFDVNAIYSGGQVQDHTVEKTSGTTVSVTAGASYELSRRVRVGAEAFYSWLSVQRPPATAAANDGLFNVRAVVSYRVR